MARSLRHRGPDKEVFFLEQGIGLACRRLSIVGLVATDSSPFTRKADRS